ncbi:MAG: hypothetical protein PHC95_04440 [Parabacteroides sp.]|nr:hypothetical protein [Parabacteroides sp.]
MRDKIRQRVVQYLVLLAGILALLSVVIPHHHHRDGMPCYESLTAEQAHGDKSADTHDCGCDGHNLAYFSTHISHFTDGGVDMHLMPLLILFDYIYPSELASQGQLLDSENAPYIESLHDTWIVSASGLRAPPMS